MQRLDPLLAGLLGREACLFVPLRCARLPRLFEVALGLSEPVAGPVGHIH